VVKLWNLDPFFSRYGFLTFFLRNIVRKFFSPSPPLTNFFLRKIGPHFKILWGAQEAPLRHWYTLQILILRWLKNPGICFYAELQCTKNFENGFDPSKLAKYLLNMETRFPILLRKKVWLHFSILVFWTSISIRNFRQIKFHNFIVPSYHAHSPLLQRL
jgi:hypothetical protein